MSFVPTLPANVGIGHSATMPGSTDFTFELCRHRNDCFDDFRDFHI